MLTTRWRRGKCGRNAGKCIRPAIRRICFYNIICFFCYSLRIFSIRFLSKCWYTKAQLPFWVETAHYALYLISLDTKFLALTSARIYRIYFLLRGIYYVVPHLFLKCFSFNYDYKICIFHSLGWMEHWEHPSWRLTPINFYSTDFCLNTQRL